MFVKRDYEFAAIQQLHHIINLMLMNTSERHYFNTEKRVSSKKQIVGN